MASIPLSTMQARVALSCGNLQTTHPVYTQSNSLIDYINEGAKRIVLLAVIDPATKRRRNNLEIFPELRERRWYDITVTNQGYLDMPADCMVPDSLKYTKLTTAYNPSTDTEYLVEPTDIDTFALLSKTATGWPQLWVRSSTQLLIWPTPTATYLTQVVLRGIRQEQDLSNATDVLTMNEVWHPAVVDMATHLTLTALNWYEDAAKFLEQAERKVGEAVSLLGLANRKRQVRFKIAGAPH